ncbi:dienelactone hydrolase family protein [Streptomyces thermocarboxydus]|uniref:dienelactone hydrolase family protein n=1 Tax=Streptomyces sp. AC04842 TaxID=2775327 RepID=UPI001999C6A1|nr:dienelactone hydrolase family protein [Streptomyces thermocarboxydus]GHE46077.1 hypothetical protein GCM10018771_28640 [Streptomyces cellulosae]
MTDGRGTEVRVPTEGGTADAYPACPADGAPHPAVLVLTDAFGLRPAVREAADRLAGAGYTVLVPNLFHRRGPAPAAGPAGAHLLSRRGNSGTAHPG